MNIRPVIIGYGTMGRAIGQALKRGKVKIFAIGRQTTSLRAAAEINKANFVILAVKPQDAQEAIAQFKNYLGKNSVLISIMAGVSLKKLYSLSGHKKIIRLMPNLGLALGEGIAVWKASGLNRQELAKLKKFLDTITENFEVSNEDFINKATAISGSGPAYFFLLAEHLMQACRDLGFTAAESRRLVTKTFTAAALLGKNGDYAELIKKVASKRGTTEAALKMFKQKNFGKVVNVAVRAAYQRAKALNR